MKYVLIQFLHNIFQEPNITDDLVIANPQMTTQPTLPLKYVRVANLLSSILCYQLWYHVNFFLFQELLLVI